MKKLGVVITFFSLVLAAVAQTNPSLVATNTVPGGRRMSLQDCIQEALKHNLDVQIQRYNPEIALFNLRAAYGGYDPTFAMSGTHNWNNEAEEVIDGILTPSEVYNQNSFNSSIGGLLPW